MKYAVMSTWKHTNSIDWDNVKPPVDATPEGTNDRVSCSSYTQN